MSLKSLYLMGVSGIDDPKSSGERADKAVSSPKKFTMKKTDLEVRDPNLVYLTPDATAGIPRDEFYNANVYMAGFDHEGNPVNNKKKGGK